MAKQETKKVEAQIVTAVEYDGIDALMFDSVRHAKKIQELCATTEGEGVAHDAFTSFFSHDPKLKDDADMVQGGVIEQMMALPEFESLREGTKNDEISSALGAAEFAPGMIIKIAELRKKMKEKKDQADKDGKDGPKSLKEGLSEEEMSGLRQALRRSLDKAQKESDKWGDLNQGWGNDPGELKNMPAEKRMELADTLSKSDKMKRIAELAGRFRNVVNSSSANVPIHGIDEIVDIGISSDIAHMLPTELVKLIEFPDLFYQDFLEGKLLTYNLKGVEQLGRGPIICCVDDSGSMGGNREEWAKAVVLAMMALAQKQRRGFGVIFFDTKVTFSRYFKRDQKVTIQEKIEIAQHSTGGGTEFFIPLQAAFQMRADDPSLKPADIVFITDGDCLMTNSQTEEVLGLKAKTEMRIYGIAIDCYSTKSLEPFCDQVSGVSLDGDVKIDLVKDLVSKTSSLGGKK